MKDEIVIKGARVHNLKNINLTIPRNKMVVFTGVSGSGKSSLAFDTIYAEGQRRYLESLSSYARQFLGQYNKPDVESISGLSPAISIEQKSASHNPRSTVGTVTEIYDYMRVLWARIGHQYCYQCGLPIGRQTVDQIVDTILEEPEGTKIMILAPLALSRKGTFKEQFDTARRKGFARVRIGGQVVSLDDEIKLDKKKKHSIEIVIDRIVVRSEIRSRLTEAVESALKEADGIMLVGYITNVDDPPKADQMFSEKLACVSCSLSYPELSPQLFSFNSPYGMCKTCDGLGSVLEVDPDLIISDDNLSIAQGALKVWTTRIKPEFVRRVNALLQPAEGDANTPWGKLPEEAKKRFLYGCSYMYHNRIQEWEGICVNIKRLLKQTSSEGARGFYQQFMMNTPCPDCKGNKLNQAALAVKVGGVTIDTATSWSVDYALAFFNKLAGKELAKAISNNHTPNNSLKTIKITEPLIKNEIIISRDLLKEVISRLHFLDNVGLHYLTLDRCAPTLSGGEAQRIRLASQIGSGLTGVLYVLDEPSIGLHQRDNNALIDTLCQLRDLGNSVVVVEHDEETIRRADHIVDFGPGAGIFGGEIIAQGNLKTILQNKNSITGKYLSGKQTIPVPKKRRDGNGNEIVIIGARANNLKNLDIRIPLGKFIAVTGVSGSGKSSLVNETLWKATANLINGRRIRKTGDFERIDGILANIDRVINIDQDPIGRTPRSNPATYSGVWDDVRKLFSLLPESKVRGYQPGRFSFNVKGGRCEACEGAGKVRVEMHFLADVWITCEVCGGRRFNRETLEVLYRKKNIYDILQTSVSDSLELFENHTPIIRVLETLNEVGLGYISLGQSALTLSGGESQRVKLAKELCKISHGRTLYLLDEPTTGLHFDDVNKLLRVLDRLVDAGNTVLVIEHNLDVIKHSDWVIDLGPDGGKAGGELIAEGTPEQIAANSRSYTGHYLDKLLKQ